MPQDRSTMVRTIGGDNRKRNPFEGLESQIQAEYNSAWKHQKAKKDEAELRLKLFNNQRRDKEAVGDTTMFSIFQTVLASLYDDRLEATWEGKEEGDEEMVENLNALAQSDYSDMGKDVYDYFWDWNTCFFGRALLDMQEFVRDPDKNIFVPAPYVVDPITLLRDPFASSVNGDLFRRGGARYLGNERKFTKSDLKDNSHIFDDIFDNMNELSYGSGTMSLLRDAIAARDEAQNNQNQINNEQEKAFGANSQYPITVWYTNWENPKTGEVMRLKVWLANDRSKTIGIQELKTDYWPMVDRVLYPHSNDWDGTSIPDLTEDKQRARAVAQNLGLKAMKSDLQPRYLYDSNKITNRRDLDVKFNKHIPVDVKEGPVSDALMPVLNARPNMQLMNFILESLDQSAQKATATPDIQQGIQSQKDRPLGETNLIASRVDTRYSLGAKVFGWSEREHWRMWYNLYKDNFKEDIDEKVIRIVGPFGPDWRPLLKEDITPQRFDPDVFIESKNVNRAQMAEERQLLTNYFGLALQEPTANRKWAFKKLGKLNGLKKEDMDRLFPPTVDERIAESENTLLNQNKQVPVQKDDDHMAHLEVHSKADPTRATYAHIKTHEMALSIKKSNPEFFPPDQQQTPMQQPQPGQIPPPQQAAAPSAPVPSTPVVPTQ